MKRFFRWMAYLKMLMALVFIRKLALRPSQHGQMGLEFFVG